MRNKIFTFIRGYDKYVKKLENKISKLQLENETLKNEKENGIEKCIKDIWINI